MRVRGFFFSLTTACMFGLGAVLAKLLGEAFQPFFVSWLALLGGGLCVAFCQVLRRKPLLTQMTRIAWVDLLLFAVSLAGRTYRRHCRCALRRARGATEKNCLGRGNQG